MQPDPFFKNLRYNSEAGYRIRFFCEEVLQENRRIQELESFDSLYISSININRYMIRQRLINNTI